MTCHEIEDALGKLLFYVTASIIHEPYKEYRDRFEGVLKIINQWIAYYVENNDLLKMMDKEVIEARNLIDDIPFEAFHVGDFYEGVDIWFTSVVFYGSCPVAKNLTRNQLLGKEKSNDR